MGKVRVYELAKNMGLENKDLLAKLVEAGIDVASHSSSLAEEDLRKFEDFINPPVQKIEEARIKPGIIRRRRTVVREPVEVKDDVVEEPVAEDKVEEDESPIAPEVVISEPEQVPDQENQSEEPLATEQPKAEVPEDVLPPLADAEDKKPVESEIVPPETSEKKDDEAEPVASEKTKKDKTPVVERATGDRAKILGRVELPQAVPAGQRKTRNGARPARQDAKPVKAGERAGGRTADRSGGAPAGRPAARPGTTPNRGNKRIDPAPLAPLEQPLPEKEGRNKKRNKGRRSDNSDNQDGRVSRRGRRVEVFEPGRAGQKKKRGGKGSKQTKQTEVTVSKAIKRVVRISDSITVGELAKRMGVKANELIAELMRQGSMVTINHPLDFESAAILASEFNHEVENVAFDEETILEVEPSKEAEDKAEDLEVRPPVVTIMGHVDHGKTSLLDAIREANVTEGEAGGITQHIGAYDVELDGKKVTFLDTPGHEAFTAMRARGAGVTDIVILVVAADDGVMPQTKEAINHSKAAGVPLIIAVNKIDKPDANPDRVKQELTEYELVPEEWGGDTIFVEVSAKQKTNLDTLLEMILLQAEVLELQANPNKRAKGSIVEARLDKGRGPIATVLVQDGTLKIGDAIVAGLHFGRVRSMTTATGSQVKEAGPSFPVEVTGLGGVPNAGDVFHAVENEKAAKDVSQHRQSKQREIDLSKNSKVSLDQLFEKMQQGVVEELSVIVKADVQGSLEAVRDALEKLSTDACRLNVIHTGVGGISESDITLATASSAIVLGFNVRPETKAKVMAEVEKVDIRLYSVIYDAVNDIRDAMEGLLAPTLKEKELGRVEIRDTFHVSRVGTIAGCFVLEGKIVRNAQTRLVRDNVVVWQGKLSSLKRFKDDVKEVGNGYECGIGLEKYNDIKIGDILEVFEIEEVKTSL
ncbi:translation initiation factor IF-2 [uncultured Desulfuromusa sp.]|uniref:translation initiation factor IF-2 n=1 Tax=uncultured Desulfuromusa sp. TaxID=219183 RepID=UPI002AA6B36A|nr:translation initiation factor IF-2 [uncultured Desulfuromusa sp.]